MKRREAIRNSAIFLGAISLTNGALLQSCKPEMKDSWKPVFLDDSQANLLNEIAETIFPKTDTPGAKDAKVMRYLDEYASRFLTDEEKLKYKESLSLFDTISQKLGSKNFVESTIEERGKVFQSMLDDKSEAEDSPRSVFMQLRNAVTSGFFSSEIGATQVLEHVPIPGNYDGDIALASTKGLRYSG